jgi:hypothetical protein
MRKTRNAVLATAAEPTEPAVPTVGHNNPPSPITDEPLLADDLLFGAAAIANELGLDLRRTFYLLERGFIPASKTGATWTSTRSRLRRHFNGEAA